jgi:hypothetical protein
MQKVSSNLNANKKSFVKKALVLIAFFLVAILVFAGCSFIEINPNKYYKEIVASATYYTTQGVKKDVSINTQELIDGINSFGYSQYFSTSSNDTGNTNEEATKLTINDLIDRKILAEHAKAMKEELWTKKEQVKDENGDLVYEQDENGNDILDKPVMQIVYDDAFYNFDQKKAIYQSFLSINSQIATIEDTVKTEWKIETPIGGNGSEETADTTYTPFEKQIEKNKDGNFEFVDTEVSYELDPNKDAINAIDTNKVEKLDVNTFSYTSPGYAAAATKEEKDVFNEAKTRFYKQLRTFYAGRGETGKSDSELLRMEIERNRVSQEETLLMNRFQVYYTNTLKVGDVAMGNINQNFAKIFQNTYQAEKIKYATDSNGYITEAAKQAYRDNLKSTPPTAATLFAPVQNEYFTVQHILFGYSDEQTAQITKWKEQVATGQITYDELEVNIRNLSEQITAKGTEITAGSAGHNLLQLITSNNKLQLNGVDADAAGTQYDNFRDAMFAYTTDSGTLNAEGDYVMPINRYKPGKDGDETDNNDSMVKEFADMSRTIRLDTLDSKGVAYNHVGNISAPVLSEYGWHIIMYTGEVKNQFDDLAKLDINNSDTATTIANRLYNVNIKAGHNKSYYDLMYEKVSLTEFESYTDGILGALRNQMTIKWKKSTYMDVIKNMGIK